MARKVNTNKNSFVSDPFRKTVGIIQAKPYVLVPVGVILFIGLLVVGPENNDDNFFGNWVRVTKYYLGINTIKYHQPDRERKANQVMANKEKNFVDLEDKSTVVPASGLENESCLQNDEQILYWKVQKINSQLATFQISTQKRDLEIQGIPPMNENILFRKCNFFYVGNETTKESRELTSNKYKEGIVGYDFMGKQIFKHEFNVETNSNGNKVLRRNYTHEFSLHPDRNIVALVRTPGVENRFVVLRKYDTQEDFFVLPSNALEDAYDWKLDAWSSDGKYFWAGYTDGRDKYLKGYIRVDLYDWTFKQYLLPASTTEIVLEPNSGFAALIRDKTEFVLFNKFSGDSYLLAKGDWTLSDWNPTWQSETELRYMGSDSIERIFTPDETKTLQKLFNTIEERFSCDVSFGDEKVMHWYNPDDAYSISEKFIAKKFKKCKNARYAKAMFERYFEEEGFNYVAAADGPTSGSTLYQRGTLLCEVSRSNPWNEGLEPGDDGYIDPSVTVACGLERDFVEE